MIGHADRSGSDQPHRLMTQGESVASADAEERGENHRGLLTDRCHSRKHPLDGGRQFREVERRRPPRNPGRTSTQEAPTEHEKRRQISVAA